MTMRRFNAFLLAASFAGSMVACGEKEEEKEDELDIAGTWKEDCRAEDEDSSFVTFTFTETTIVAAVSQFSGAGCVAASKATSMDLTGTVKIGADAASQTTVEGATSIDMVLSTLAITLHTADKVAKFNDDALCGKTWVLDTKTDVSDCAEMKTEVGIGETEYRIYKVTDDKLFLATGSENNTAANEGKTAATRMNTFPATPATKQ